jgi:hypothetical protein
MYRVAPCAAPAVIAGNIPGKISRFARAWGIAALSSGGGQLRYEWSMAWVEASGAFANAPESPPQRSDVPAGSSIDRADARCGVFGPGAREASRPDHPDIGSIIISYRSPRFHSNAKPSPARVMKQPSPGTKCVGSTRVWCSAQDSSKCSRDRTPSCGSSSRLVPQRG